MQIKSLLLAVLCCFSFHAISQSFCVATGSPVGGSGGIASTNIAQSLTMSCNSGDFAGLVVDAGAVVSDGSPVWTLEIFQGDGFGGTLQYTQTGIALTDIGGGHIFINIAGGSGSTAYTSGSQYTFRVSTSSSTNSVTVFRNNTSFYAGGQGYIANATFGTGGDILDVAVFVKGAVASCGAATRLYVKHNASGANNGTSWANAYTSLQSAIDYARGCSNIQEIWVAAGTYKPSKDKTGNASPSNPNAKTFYVNFPVDIYGGFAGTENMLSLRNITLNPTILSGDIDNNDTANPAVTAANVQGTNSNLVLHIQNVAEGVTVDGFTVTAGQLTAGFVGGGIHNEGTGFPFGCTATIRNCKIQGNTGSAIFNSGNLDSYSAGSAILVVENSSISGNTGNFNAAGIHSNSNGGNTNVTVNNCTFSNNTSTGSSQGGAYYEHAISGDGTATFSNCIFRDNNSTTTDGAAVHANGQNVGTVNHTFTNCVFMNNTSAGKGGAYYANGASSGRITTVFTNCTFYDNEATNSGGAIAYTTNLSNTSMLLRNCIVWQNPNEILLEGNAIMTLSNSLINSNSAPSGVISTVGTLFNTDPLFVDAVGGNLRLQNCSPARNSGTSSGAPSTDLDNNARPALGGYDMGAYEAQTGSAPTTYYADADGDGFGNPSVSQQACTQPVGYVTDNTDCNDNSNLEKPGQVWYKDSDNDAYAETDAATITDCLRPVGYKVATELSATSGDCNDNNAAIKPGATEICDGIDNNCDGTTDGAICSPDYTITTTAGAIVITDAAGNGETLSASQSSTNIRFDVTGRTYSLNGGPTLNFPADVALAGASSITINTASGSDIINIAAFTSNLPSLTINGGIGDDQVNFNGDITFATNANLDVDLQNDAVNPGTDQLSFTNNANLVLSGTGTAVIKVSRNISFNNGTAALETTNGNLTLEANQQATASTGNFVGISVNGATVRVNGAGTLTVKGKSGNDSAFNQFGVAVQNGGLISGGTSGTATIEGSAGAGSANGNIGVYVTGTNARITSLGSHVAVTGLGGSTGASSTCRGVVVGANGTISAGGSGNVNVNGTGGAGTGNFNVGVNVAGSATTLITSSGGNVTVTGMGGGSGSGSNNYGIWQELGGTITAGGSGTVTVNGTGGATSGGSNFGIVVNGSTTVAQITSSGGNVSVTGQGGGTSFAANNYGITVQNGGQIIAGGSGTVTLNGTGGASSGDNNHGVYVLSTGALVSSSGGNVTVNGTGGGTSSSSGNNIGVYVFNSSGVGLSSIAAGGMGTLTINGTGGPTSDGENYGVNLDGLSQITSGGGNISITGIEGSAAVGIANEGGGSITTATNGGNISLIANSIFIGSVSTVSTNNSGTTTLRQRSNGVQIDIGSAAEIPNGPVGLADFELDRITTGTLIIGDANSGNLTVSLPISRPTSANVQLISAGDVLISGGGFNTGGGTLLLDPGTSPAAVKPSFNGTDVTASTLSFASDLEITINGTTVGNGTGSTYTQLKVVGAVNLSGVDLLFTGTYVPVGGNTFTIVDNDGSDAIIGTFTGLAEGATIPNFRGSGLNATISYIGGSGNDVVITVITPAAPEINIKGNGFSILNGDNSPRTADLTDFGNIDIFSTDPVVRTFTIQNIGTANLVIPVGGITKSGAPDFGIGTVFLPFTIAPGDSATFPVIIDASGNGLRTATISIQSNDSDESPYTFTVRAVGVSPEINVTGLGQNINSGDTSPSTLDDTDFGSLDVNAATLSHTFTIQNVSGSTGDLYLNAGAITVSGTHASDFSISGITLPATVSPGQSITFVVTFNPSAIGTRTATIRIANNDLGESQYLFDVKGVGITPDYTINTMVNVLTITDVAGNGEILDITQNGTNIRFDVTGRTYSLNGAPATAFTTPADVDLAGITSIVVNAAAGNDNINIDAFSANLPNLTINGGVGDDAVNFNGDITFATNASLDVDLQNDDATPGVDAFAVANNVNLLLSGTGTASVKVSKTIFINNDGSIETQNGALTLEANQQATSSTGYFTGIRINPGALIRSVNGNISLAGLAGTANSFTQHGIENLGTITTTGTGNILLVGMGGPPVEDNDGVRNEGSLSATGSGDIWIRGFSTTSLASEAFANQANASVTTTSGDITIEGDIIYIDPTSSVSAASNQVIVEPTTVSRAIDLGTEDSATQLGLTDAELDRITTGTVIIGNATSGTITVSQAISRPSSTNVQLISAGDVLISGGGFNTGGGTLLLDPGASPAAVKPTFNGTDVTASTLSFASDLSITINGTTLGDGTAGTYSQLKVLGAVNLTGVDLLFTGAYVPIGGNTFTIVDNDGTDAIIGTFTGLAEGATFTNFRGSGLNATISYVGGTGNDVVLTVINNVVCYADTDGDGFGDPNNSMTFVGTCGTGFVSNNTDCDDSNIALNPNTVWYLDADGDNYYTGTGMTQCTSPGTGYRYTGLVGGGDCNDNLATINPGATEICNGVDDDCDGTADDGITYTTYYQDSDGDSFGNPSVSQSTCNGAPVGYVINNTDCDDSNISLNPNTVWYLDADGDNYYTGTGMTQCTSPGTGYRYTGLVGGGDCNDNLATINPGATEICNGLDDDCDGTADDGITYTTYYQDSDGDSFGNPSVSQSTCNGAPVGYVTNNTDCDDSNIALNPNTVWYLDADGDNYYTGTGMTQCTSPGTGYRYTGLVGGGDCNDNLATINPGATEICNGLDDDCDGTADDGITYTTYYQDSDGDSFGNPSVSQSTCNGAPVGYVSNNTDCDDSNISLNPNTVWYLDADGDNYYTGTGMTQCTSPGTGYRYTGLVGGGDCNDNLAAINPGATEICNGLDDDCDGTADDGITYTTYYQDSDGDSFGNPSASQSTCNGAPVGYVTNNTDCDDSNISLNPNTVWYLDADGDNYYTGTGMTQCTSPGTGYRYTGLVGGGDCNDNLAAINPGATEICNGLDDDCDGTADDGITYTTYYQDSDGDSFGNPSVSQSTCNGAPVGYVTNNTDCDDSNIALNPNTVWYLDADGDNYYTGTGMTQCTSPGTGYRYTGLVGGGDCNDNLAAINPGATEICNGLDDNCNGVTDEGCTVPMASIHDPCTCVNNSPVIENGTTTNAGTFSETVTIEASSGQTWRIVNVRDLYSDINATIPYTMGMIIPETGVGTGVYELAGYHYDGVGYAIEVTNGDTILNIDNKCFYPDPVFTGLPALVAPTAAPFQVTGTVANNAAGTGTFILDGMSPPLAPSPGPAPTVVTINPATLSVGTHTLEYSFDADTAASKDPSNPGCVQVVRQRFQVAHCGCQDVTVSLDASCQFVLTGNLVSDANCGVGTVRVMDNNPSNGNIIDCAGVWTYGLFDSFGNIICWGKVTAEDKTGPQLLCPTAPVPPLDCYDVSYVLNNRLTIGNPGASNNASPRLASDRSQTITNAEGVRVDETLPYICPNLAPPNTTGDAIKNLGYPYYKDNCYNPVPSAQNPNCGCRTTLKWSDKVRYLSCTDPLFTSRRVYAIIEREWVATDCNGMLGDPHTQIIEFVRPLTTEFSFKDETRDGVRTMSGAVAKTPGYDWVVEYSSCTPNESLITKKDVTPSGCSYFDTPGNPRCLYIDEVECNYSVSIKDTKFPICGGKGVKIDRDLYVFDWCAGKIVDTFNILIKIGDFQAPTCEYAHGAPFDISTGPMDCTAAIPVTLAGIKSAFGVTIKDNCDNIANVSVKVYTKDRYVKGILVAQGNENPFYCATNAREEGAELRGDHDSYRKTCARVCWDSVDYAVMNGMMIGLPTGRYLMKIDAFDGCYNAGQCCFIFDVKDKIAPVMKCDDDLHITLSNANGYTNGYAQVSAADIDEGSWDNCKMGWIGVRRNVPDACAVSFIAKGYDTNGNGKLDAAVGKDLNSDGDFSDDGESLEDGADGYDRNGDGDLKDFGETFVLKGGKLMTPIQDEVEFFCCDLAERVTIELWGEDFAGNRNYCWNDVLIEDKVAPTCVAPWNTTIDCDDKNIALIDDREASSKIWGDVTISSGSDCANLAVVYSTVKTLKCGYGKIVRKWAITKETAKGPVTINCEQTIYVHPKHEYDIRFPKDASTDCKTPSPDTVIVDELACDLLAVNVSDKRYDATGDECYKIFRTYTVMNWCAYDDRCGDPMAEGNVFVVDRGTFANHGKNPLHVLVRDRDYKVRLRDATANSNPYLSYTDNGLTLTGGQYGALSAGASSVKEFNSSSTEYEFKRDHTEEFWISADATVGNSSTFANGDNDADNNNNTKRDILVTQKMPYCPIAFSGNNNQTPEGEFYHSFMYTQIIKVYDDVRPVVSGVRDTFCTSATGCTANITKVVNLQDNCSDKVTLETQYLMIAPLQTTEGGKMIVYSASRWSIRDLGNGNHEISVSGLPEGTHDLIVVGRDECGNLSVATRIPFVVKDCKAPAPICINGLSTGIMPDGNGGGMMAVWATDFVASKIYDCNGQGTETKDGLKLVTKYSINRVGQAVNVNQTSLNFTCADIAVSPILVELHAWDEAGNHDFCVTFVELIDSRGVCPGSVSVNIAGTIATEGTAKLQGASITLSGAASQSTISTANGAYSFLNLAQGGDFTVTPQLDKNHLNGVSTFDLVLIQKHILGVQALNSPYKLIAADVNNSKSISTLDLIALRKLILNIDTHFANNTSWRFVDAAYRFPNTSNPWVGTFPEVVSVNDLAGNIKANFVAIKVGDVNASASVNNAASAEIRANSNFELKTQEQNLKSGNEYKITFRAEDLKNIQGYQFALNLDQSKVELLDMEYGVAKAENFGVFKQEGIITTSWNSKYEPGALFTLVLRAKADTKLSQSLNLNRLVHAEAYDQNNDYLGIKLAFEGEQISESYELKQNTPNPFGAETSIGFSLPKATKATLTIRDVKGALVYKVEDSYTKGSNQITLKKEQLGASGVLYYTLETSDFTATKKMVLLHE